jgi:hypothetical protein
MAGVGSTGIKDDEEQIATAITPIAMFLLSILVLARN